MSPRKVAIDDIANIKVGINLSRGAESPPDTSIYTLKDQEDDLTSTVHTKPGNTIKESKNYIIKEGDIIINLGVRKCSVVSKENSGKIIKNTFAKIELTDSFIDPWFLCYFINESPDFKKSIATDVIGVIRPLSVAILGKAEIVLPSPESQKAIGIIYHDLCRISYLNTVRKELLMNAINKISTTN